MIGTSRLVLDSPLGFPLEEHCQDNLFLKQNSLSRKNCAEISRLVISKQLRRRRNDGLYYSPDYVDNPKDAATEKENLIKRIKPMTFGIFKEMYQESKRKEIKHWYVLMEKTLHLLLKIHGFVFNPIGEEINFYGPVRPYLANLEDLEKGVLQKFPNLYNYFTDELEPQYRPINR
jgi:N-acyl amino acid synthase of PEP-CTERM/exosortase system